MLVFITCHGPSNDSKLERQQAGHLSQDWLDGRKRRKNPVQGGIGGIGLDSLLSGYKRNQVSSVLDDSGEECGTGAGFMINKRDKNMRLTTILD